MCDRAGQEAETEPLHPAHLDPLVVALFLISLMKPTASLPSSSHTIKGVSFNLYIIIAFESRTCLETFSMF